MKRLKKSLKEIKKDIIRREKLKYNNKKIRVKNLSCNIDSCLCVDRNGNFKELYRSERDAQFMAKFIFDEHGVNLMVYPCPYSSGWHLTKY